jgi:hypothetical protein
MLAGKKTSSSGQWAVKKFHWKLQGDSSGKFLCHSSRQPRGDVRLAVVPGLNIKRHGSAPCIRYASTLRGLQPAKLLGIPGGVLLTVGAATLMWFKTKADPELGAPSVWGGEMAFLGLLGATGTTGLALYAATGTSLDSPLLALHFGTVLAFFLTMPHSKMVHGFYRLAALIRDAQIKQA